MASGFSHNKRGGYIALISAVIISLVLTGLAYMVARSGFFSRFDSLNAEYKRISKGMAESCANLALLELAQNPKINTGSGDGGTIDCQYQITSTGFDPDTHEKTANVVALAHYPNENGAYSTMAVSSTVYDPQYSAPSKITVNAYSYGEGAKAATAFAPFIIKESVSGAEKVLGGDDLGNAFSFEANKTYKISEGEDADYIASYSGDCDSGGHITLGVNDYQTCNIINTIKPQTAKLTVIISSEDATYPEHLVIKSHATGEILKQIDDPDEKQQFPIGPGSYLTNDANYFDISVDEVAGYNVSDWAGSTNDDDDPLCYGDYDDGTVKLKKGDNIVCAITFAKQAPPPDTVIMLDRTGSMSWTDLADEKTAAKSLLQLLEDIDPAPYVGIGVFASDNDKGAKIAGPLTNSYGSETVISANSGAKLAGKSGTNVFLWLGGGENDWLNPDRGRNIDTTFASNSIKGDQQDYSNFGFNIPADALITGIEANIDGKITPLSAQTAVLYPVSQGYFVDWENGKNTIDETGSPKCSSSDFIRTGIAGERESININLDSIPDGAIVTRINVIVYDRADAATAGTYKTFIRLNGVVTDAANNLVAASDSGCASKNQQFDMAGVIKSSSTALEIGVVKTPNNANTVRVGAIRATVDYIVDNGQIGIQISSNNGNSWTSAKTQNLVATEKAYILGGGSDVWGRAWEDGDFANGSYLSGSGFAIRVENQSATGVDVSLNYVTIKVFYSYSSSATGLYATINSELSSKHGGTDLSAAISQSNGELNSIRHVSGNNKFIILVSDGLPTYPGNGYDVTEQSKNAALGAADTAKTWDGVDSIKTTIYTIHYGDASGRDFLARLATGDEPISGHQSGSKNDVDVPDNETLIYNENHDGDHFYISPTSAEMEDIFQMIGEEIMAPTVGELPPNLVVVTQANNSSGTASLEADDFDLDINVTSSEGVTKSVMMNGSETGDLIELSYEDDYAVEPQAEDGYSYSTSPDCDGHDIGYAQTKTCVVVYTADPPPAPAIEIQQNIDINSWTES